VVCGARVRRSIPPSRRASSRLRRPQASQDQAAAARPVRPGLVSHQARWGVLTTSSKYGDNQRCPTLTLPPPDAYHRKTRPQNCSMTDGTWGGLTATSRWPPRRGFTPGAERRPRQLTAPAGDRVWCWSRLRTTRIDEQSTVASPSARDGSHRHLHLRVRLERLPRGHRPRHHRGHEDRSKGHCADTSLPDSATSGCCS
jgi:hypothetical protein